MAFLDDVPPPTTFAYELDDLVDRFLEDGLPLGEVIEAMAAQLEELRAEEADHDRAIETGGAR